MSIFNQLSPEDRAFLMALPYRTGLWISQCDSTGGGDATAQELRALEQLIVGYGEDFLKSEFVEDLMLETVAHRDKWPQWHRDMGDIAGDCRRAVDLLAPVLERRDIASLKSTLMEIAETVAKAYQEEVPDMTLGTRVATFVAHLRNRPAPLADALANISRAERAALDALAAALRLGEAEGLPPSADFIPEDTPNRDQ